jgi:hypothetical protein
MKNSVACYIKLLRCLYLFLIACSFHAPYKIETLPLKSDITIVESIIRSLVINKLKIENKNVITLEPIRSAVNILK